MEMDYTDLGKRIQQLRRERRFTQEELAKRAGISTAFLGHIERGSRVASLETLVQLCNALKTDANTLLAASLTCLPDRSLTEMLKRALDLAMRQEK